ncbi:hypothetical protein MIND_00591900 [Mycena indigotica]|uniref:Uncharacterized protein n=1 Tax=Mycena indigotica TaxID=2126181 RepID=A0A8H6SRZ7_9AGAR|nr:uncharacterized protein MIND_00591900 [Mycena indigotica]KAF7303626.1 hypothetical protein MIND_00591900 [Mycena indigotica]
MSPFDAPHDELKSTDGLLANCWLLVKHLCIPTDWQISTHKGTSSHACPFPVSFSFSLSIVNVSLEKHGQIAVVAFARAFSFFGMVTFHTNLPRQSLTLVLPV